jgi:peptidoglycan/LPS O-acetylase OafA/YrhL
VAYVAGACLLLQVFDVVGDKFGWPATVFRTTTALLVVDLLAALVLARFHGEKGEQKVRGIELLMLAVLCVLAAAAVAFVSGGTRQSGETTTDLAGSPSPSASAVDPGPWPCCRSWL